jgi:hypothetical protein
MTGEDDMDDVPEHLIPEEQVEAILSGEDPGADLSELLAPVAALLGRAQQPPSPVEQLEVNAAIATIVEVRRAAIDELTSRRTRMLPAFSKRTAAIVVGVTLWSTIGVAAATGNLPLGISGGDTSGQSSLQELADDTTTTTEATTTSTSEATTTTEATTTSTSEVTTTTEATTTSTSEVTTTTAATSTTTATSTPGTSVAGPATSASVAARGVGPDPNGPAKSGLCNAYLKGLANGKPKNPNAPPWRNLLQAAGDGGVEEFCGVTTTTTAPATTTASTAAPTTVSVSVTAAAAVVHGNGNGNGNGNGHGN